MVTHGHDDASSARLTSPANEATGAEDDHVPLGNPEVRPIPAAEHGWNPDAERLTFSPRETLDFARPFDRSDFQPMSTTPDSDAQIIASWHDNATPWSAAVRNREIESRRLVTDAAIVDAVMARAPRTVLDIGCGEGWLSRALAARGIGVTGIDVVPSLVDAARSAQPDGDYRVSSYEDVATGALDVTVDLAVANFSLIGDEAVDGLVRRVPSLLVPRGYFIVQTLHPATSLGEHPYRDGWRPGSWAGFGAEFTNPAPWYFRTLESWITLLTGAGLALQELREPVHPSRGTPISVILVAQSV